MELGGPEYYIDLKKHTKSHSGAYQKKKMIKNINLISKQEYQNLQREASSLMTQDIHKK